MNVLILTPDAVGSTLLQRLLTIYMQFHEFDRPVINLHELTNGLEIYFSTDFNCPIVSKRKVKNWGYHQSLEEIVKLLSSADHYKTSRLAQYHIKNRQDPIEQQIPFYKYLDENFFVIACRRRNVFEHALSMSINSITKRLNVYSHQEKIDVFLDMYSNPVDIDQTVLIRYLEDYRQYLTWSQSHFNIGSYFDYDRSINDIENYILSLPIFKRFNQRITWQQKFGISLDDWNRCHWIPSDLGRLEHEHIKSIRHHQNSSQPDPLVVYQQLAPLEWPAVQNHADLENLPTHIQQRFQEILQTNLNKIPVTFYTSQMIQFLQHNQTGYENSQQAINRMKELDILTSAPPIKKQTLQNKINTINNFQQCLETYNQWAENHSDIVDVIDNETIKLQIHEEHQFWNDLRVSSFSESDLPPSLKLEHQNDDDLGPNLRPH